MKESPVQFPNSFGSDLATGRPLEVEAMYRLRNLGCNDSFVQLRNWRPFRRPTGNEPGAPGLNPYYRRYRLYMEYCGHGDLHGIEERYRTGAADEPMPEPFLWALFESLAAVGNLMWRGDVDGQREEWREIMHGDLKSSNVFLGQKNSSGIYDK